MFLKDEEEQEEEERWKTREGERKRENTWRATVFIYTNGQEARAGIMLVQK